MRAVGASDSLVLLSMSAAARAAIAVHCGLGLRETFGRLSGFFKGVGCHAVFDTGLATDLCLLQTGAELCSARVAAAAGAAAGAVAAPPLLTSTPRLGIATPRRWWATASSSSRASSRRSRSGRSSSGRTRRGGCRTASTTWR